VPVEPQTVIEPQVIDGEFTIAASETLPALETANLSPERAEALRERYRTATPEQRAALRSALRDRRQTRQIRRGQ
jgi:Spy/CpxP family protein refolding chaperone